jgi:methionine-rich copper-binding protein CopC
MPLLAALLAGTPSAAWAHAQLLSATPAENAEVAPPAAVVLDFSQPLEKRFCRIEVEDAAGHRVDAGSPPGTLGRGEFGAALPTLAAGTYRVIWHVTSIDTHRTEGSFSFTVLP